MSCTFGPPKTRQAQATPRALLVLFVVLPAVVAVYDTSVYCFLSFYLPLGLLAVSC